MGHELARQFRTPLLSQQMSRSDNIFRWKCQIPGKEGTDWAGGYFPLTIEFSEGVRCPGLLACWLFAT